MFNFFKKNTPAAPSVPQPLCGRKGHVGGIEALSLDGKLYFFGFDYRGVLVISPLIPDAMVMARFASEHMEQLDGAHDEAYWRELVGDAIDDSLLCDPESRNFDTRVLAEAIRCLGGIRLESTPEPDFAIPYHLRYLLEAAAGSECVNDEDSEALIGIVTGEDPVLEGLSLSDVAGQLQNYLDSLVDAAPGNWATLFAMLKSR